MTPRHVHVAGLPIVPATVQAATEMALADADAGRTRMYVFVNAHSAKLRREHPAYDCVLADTQRAVALADGRSISWAARMLGHGDIGTVPGPDLLEELSARTASGGIPVFFLGGQEGVAQELAAALCRRYPGILVAGTATPPFGDWSDETSRELVRQVKESGARFLWLGVSAPKQEIWAHRWLDELGMPVLCVGAAFDFSAGRVRRAPVWMRRAGFEWVHRLATEPRRMWRRYLLGNPVFVADVIRWWRRPATDLCGE